MRENINILPVPTWNYLGVNAAKAEIHTSMKTEQAELFISSMPEGVKLTVGDAWTSEAAEKTLEKPTDKTLEKSTDKTLEKPTDKTLEKPSDKTSDKISDKTSDKISENKTELIPESGMGSSYDQFVSNHAGWNVKLEASTQTDEVVSLHSMLTPEHPFLTGYYTVYAEEGAAVTVLQSVCSEEGTEGQSAELTRIYAAKDSVVRLIIVQNLGTGCSGFQAAAIYAEEGARVEVIRAVLGGNALSCGVKTVLAGSRSKFQMDTIYFGDGRQNLDFNDVVVHEGRETESDMSAAGVLAGESSKIYRGTIDFKRGAKYAAGHEKEDVLLFGRKVKNRTVPLILCGEESVEGQHAATAGRLQERQIYYLTSRGLTESQARNLLVEGRFATVMDAIPDETLRAELAAGIERRLEAIDTGKK